LIRANPHGGTIATQERRRFAAFTATSAALLLLCLMTGLFLASRETPEWMVAAHAALFVAGGLVWLTALQWGSPPLGSILLALAILARLALLGFPPSDDVNRYLWEGRLVLAGESPYAQPASAAAEPWQDAIWHGMNNRERLTAYPPLAQLVFATATAVAYHPLPLKLLFVAAEMGVLLIILGELRRRSLPVANLALAAFNPVMLLGTAGEAHFDALFVLPLLLAVRALSHGRCAWAWLWLATAIQIKIVGALLLPLFLRRGGWRTAWAALPVAVLPALPFLSDLTNLARGIFEFGVMTTHNGFVTTILASVFGIGGAVAGAIYGVLAVWTVLVTWKIDDPWRASFYLFTALFLLSPVTHFWYLSWIVPFLPLMPHPAWLLLSGLQAVYYLNWAVKANSGVWTQPAWAWWAQWLPFATVLMATSLPTFRRMIFRKAPLPTPQRPQTVTAIIPVYDEADRIADCIEALRRQGPAVSEIIVVDGRSADASVERARAMGAQVLSAPRGRGHQIAAGVARARGDVVWIVHADVSPAPATAQTILDALDAEPSAAGGAAGQRFAGQGLPLLVIEWLNAARSALFGLSFGDQGQFIRRSALASIGGYPDLPLMEDVELSLRLRQSGPVLHLGRNGVACTRRWDRTPPLTRAWTVMRLTATYLLSRDRRALADRLFRVYYPREGPKDPSAIANLDRIDSS
jgi:rSAM/selenodomain-associated transferase 2